jgi:crotonobetainyl-CoA:carnitine CoA-transferase CaiB-like acyl-CoA transferase
VTRVGVMAAFGCNYQGDIPPAQVVKTLDDGMKIAEETGATIELFSFADTMGWATPVRIERVIGAVRERWPDMKISLHLHDTRGLAVANAHAGLKMGVTGLTPPLAVWAVARSPVTQGRRQYLHRGTRAAVRGDGHRYRRRSRQADRGRPHGGRNRRPSIARRIDPRRKPGRVPADGGLMSARPLAGLKVLEFTHTVMGPTAGLIFAELGADVVKVEPAPNGDHTRRLGGFGAGFFAAFNRNKRSLAIDLKQPEGQAAMYRLVEKTDIVLENYGPGTMERLKCGYEHFAPHNQRLIYLALKGYLAGPYEHRPALDEVVQFQTGLAWMTGPPGRPLRAGASVIDIMGAVFGVVAAQAALRERDITGKGQRVSSALFESAAFLMSTHMAGMAATGLEARPMPARRGAWAIYEVFNTANDGQLFIGVTSDQQWARFVEEFGLQELAADPRSGDQRDSSRGTVLAYSSTARDPDQIPPARN